WLLGRGGRRCDDGWAACEGNPTGAFGGGFPLQGRFDGQAILDAERTIEPNNVAVGKGGDVVTRAPVQESRGCQLLDPASIGVQALILAAETDDFVAHTVAHACETVLE